MAGKKDGPKGQADGFADLFDMFGGQGGFGGRNRGPMRGVDVQHTIHISLEVGISSAICV